jgi:hypothetical protein
MIERRREVLYPMVDHPIPIPGYVSWLFPQLIEWLMMRQYKIDGEKIAFLKDVGGEFNPNKDTLL